MNIKSLLLAAVAAVALSSAVHAQALQATNTGPVNISAGMASPEVRESNFSGNQIAAGGASASGSFSLNGASFPVGVATAGGVAAASNSGAITGIMSMSAPLVNGSNFSNNSQQVFGAAASFTSSANGPLAAVVPAAGSTLTAVNSGAIVLTASAISPLVVQSNFSTNGIMAVGATTSATFNVNR